MICSGTTLSTVLVDKTGQPVRAAHICPDCALDLLSVAGLSEPQGALAELGSTGRTLFHDMCPGRNAPADLRARAPPWAV